MLNKEYDITKTPLDYYFQDYQNKISWKKDRDYTYHRGDKDRNQWLLDLNYFEFNGTLDQVAMQIAERTENPHLRTPVVRDLLFPILPVMGEMGMPEVSRCVIWRINTKANS
jgi:hypothetical protein